MWNQSIILNFDEKIKFTKYNHKNSATKNNMRFKFNSACMEEISFLFEQKKKKSWHVLFNKRSMHKIAKHLQQSIYFLFTKTI